MNVLLELPEAHTRVLLILLELIPPEEYNWALTGSAGLRLQGVDIPVNDIDIQTDGESVYAIEKCLSSYMMETIHPWESEQTFSLYGKAKINNLKVELLGDIKHREQGGSWEKSIDISSSRIWINWSNLKVPVIPLEFEAQAYSKMGRTERASLIREAIRS
jgi:hypothetical protein